MMEMHLRSKKKGVPSLNAVVLTGLERADCHRPQICPNCTKQLWRGARRGRARWCLHTEVLVLKFTLSTK